VVCVCVRNKRRGGGGGGVGFYTDAVDGLDVKKADIRASALDCARNKLRRQPGSVPNGDSARPGSVPPSKPIPDTTLLCLCCRHCHGMAVIAVQGPGIDIFARCDGPSALCC
jgi:hypothetical protein